MFSPLSVRVYLEDTDAGGVVYHASYVRFLERARTEALRAAGLEQSSNFGRDESLVVAKMCLHFHAAAVLDDLLLVTCRTLAATGARVTFEQEILRSGGEVVCRAEVEVACISLATRRVRRLPDAVRTAFTVVGRTGLRDANR